MWLCERIEQVEVFRFNSAINLFNLFFFSLHFRVWIMSDVEEEYEWVLYFTDLMPFAIFLIFHNLIKFYFEFIFSLCSVTRFIHLSILREQAEGKSTTCLSSRH